MAGDLFPLGDDTTEYRKLTGDFVSVDSFRGQEILAVEPEGLRLLAEAASIAAPSRGVGGWASGAGSPSTCGASLTASLAASPLSVSSSAEAAGAS